MAEQFDRLGETHISFIKQQKMFFVGSASRDGRVNVSPKGHDCLKILSPAQLVWLNLTGSGNETAAHLLDQNRMTLMWCAFEGPPQILRIYGSARTIHPRDQEWSDLAQLIAPPLGARQYYVVDIDLVQTSCGYAVPLYEYQEDRQALTRWNEKKGSQGIEEYWQDRNTLSLDGAPTRILE
ncbi:MAG: pyridoxamine 5'-phosphate oxidase family protein [Proteobacteria bacterium]|nr:pyridoxamine 5'-phosphate oxidase family protein [Pseudomonadota bacterium]